MAEAFLAEDVVRILKTLLPTDRPDPLGELREIALDTNEDLLGGQAEAEERFAALAEEMTTLKALSFGRMLLGVLRTMRFVFGLLPAGRFILIALAVLSVVDSYLDGKTISTKTFTDAAESSGLTGFLTDAIARFQEPIDEKIAEIQSAVAILGEVFTAAQLDVESTLAGLTAALDASLSAAATDGVTSAAHSILISEVTALLDIDTGTLPGVATLMANSNVIFGGVFNGLASWLENLKSNITTIIE